MAGNHSIHFSEAYPWLVQSERRKQIVRALTQPLTASQLSQRIDLSRDACSHLLWELFVYGLVRCLNEHARRSRVYWLTYVGLGCQHKLYELLHTPLPTNHVPNVDWHLYGWVCFSHRQAIIKALLSPMQPSAIKRRARQQNLKLRMSANNVRDVIRLFLAKNIVRPVHRRRSAHPLYELTDVGIDLQRLLYRAIRRDSSLVPV